MGVNIQPNFLRKAVPFAKTACNTCGSSRVVAYETFHLETDSCDCGGWFELPEFYPTEFKWEEAHWTYTHMNQLLNSLGLPDVEQSDYAGEIDPVWLLKNINNVRLSDREVLTEIAQLSIKLKVSISWY